MRKILAIVGCFSVSTALASTKVSEKFVATFSDYNQFDNIVTCSPGFRGHFPTADVVSIEVQGVDTGLYVSDKYTSQSHLGLQKDHLGKTKVGQRPFEEGCKLALDQIKAAIQGKDIIELTIHRTVTSSPNTAGRAYRKVNGDVVRVQYVTTEQNFESLRFELGGHEFISGQVQNGRSQLR